MADTDSELTPINKLSIAIQERLPDITDRQLFWLIDSITAHTEAAVRQHTEARLDLVKSAISNLHAARMVALHDDDAYSLVGRLEHYLITEKVKLVAKLSPTKQPDTERSAGE